MAGHGVFRSSLLPCLLVMGCALFDRDDGGDPGDGDDPARGEWIAYQPADASCGNGDPYAFYVQFSETGSENLLIYFEAGGVCWDYAGCTPGAGGRNPANLEGLPEDYANMNLEISVDSFAIRPNVKVVYPLLNDDPEISPMAEWNKVFVPYCTGDAYSGAFIATYPDPNGLQPDNEFRHVGHLNVLAMIEMLDGMFDRVDRLFVGGGSAGGIGALVNYSFIREGLNVEGQSYVFNDAGPVFPEQASTSRTTQLYERGREVWGLDDVIDGGLPSPEAIKADFGALNPALAEAYPDARFATAFFRLDYNVPLYSYERFYERDNGTIRELFDGSLGLDQNVAADRTAFYSLWWDDVELFRDQYDGVGNLGYFMPYWRQTNQSHLTAIVAAEESEPFDLASNLLEWISGQSEDLELEPDLVWVGTEITTEGGRTIDIRDYVDILLDDQATLPSYFEEEEEGPFYPCTPGEGSEPLMPIPVDEAECEAAAGSN